MEKKKRSLILVACGECAGKPVEMRAMVSEQAPDAALLPRLWARARVDDLLELAEIGSISQPAAREEVIPLALAHNLLTKYTAFLAIDNQAAAVPGEANFIQVSHPLPEGLDAAGFLPPRVASVSAAYAVLPPSSYQAELDIPTFLRSIRGGQSPMAVNPASLARKGNRFSLADNIDLPTVPERAHVQDVFSPKPKGPRVSKSDIEPDLMTSGLEPAQVLQELARTQKLDGSWSKDVELTAAALIAFARHGHTTARGHFRKQVARAFTWLTQASVQGFPAFFRAQAFQELASLTQLASHLAAAENALRSLPEPVTNLEAVCAATLRQTSRPPKQPDQVDNLDQLRLVAVTNARGIKVSPDLMTSNLGRVLVACISG